MKLKALTVSALLATAHCGHGAQSSKVAADTSVGSVVTIAGYTVSADGVAIDAWTNECTASLTPKVQSQGPGLTQVQVLSGERSSDGCFQPQVDVKNSFFIPKAAFDEAGISLENFIIINNVKR